MKALDKVRIHPTAHVSPTAILGFGTSIWHQSQVRERARIGRNCVLGKGVYVDIDVTIGDNCKLQNGVFVYHPATLDNGVFLGPGVIITNDKIPRAVNPDMTIKTSDDWIASPVRISEGVSIGAASVVLPGVTIGRWAMVGAGSVVTRDTQEYSLVLGNPARHIGYVCPCGARLKVLKFGKMVCSSCGAEIRLKGEIS